MRVLVLAHNYPALPALIRNALGEMGVHTDYVDDPEDMVVMATEPYDLLLVVILSDPRVSLQRLIRALRKKGVSTPVVVLGPDTTQAEEIAACYDAGGDGYLEGPKHASELSAYMHAIVRRSTGQIAPTVVIDDLEIDLRRKMVKKAGVLVDLTLSEYLTIEVLALRQGQVLSQSHVYFLTKGGDTADNCDAYNTVSVLLNRIRAKLGDRAPGRYIKTVRGLGLIIPLSSQTFD